MTTTERLERLRNRTTRYELVATHHADGRRVLLVYSSRNNRTGLWHAIVDDDDRRNAVIRLTGGPAIDFAKRSRDGATMGEWHIGWSGRTQRDAILGGELEYVEDLIP